MHLRSDNSHVSPLPASPPRGCGNSSIPSGSGFAEIFEKLSAKLNKGPQLITYCFSTGTRTSAFNAVSLPQTYRGLLTRWNLVKALLSPNFPSTSPKLTLKTALMKYSSIKNTAGLERRQIAAANDYGRYSVVLPPTFRLYVCLSVCLTDELMITD